MTRRKTLVDVLFTICLTRFSNENWKIKKSLIAKSGSGKTLALVEKAEHSIILFPRVLSEKDPIIECNLLHELLHIGFDLDSDYEPYIYWLERYMWRKLTVEQKSTLSEMVNR